MSRLNFVVNSVYFAITHAGMMGGVVDAAKWSVPMDDVALGVAKASYGKAVGPVACGSSTSRWGRIVSFATLTFRRPRGGAATAITRVDDACG